MADLVEAFLAYERGDFARAAKIARAVAAKPDMRAGAHYLLGLVALERDRPAEALKSLEQAARTGPTSPALDLAVARACLALGDHGAAIERFEAVLDAAPQMADAAFGLARARLGLGDDAGAVAALERALALRPRDVAGWLELAGCLRALARFEAAHEAAERAVRLDEANRAARRVAGFAAFESGAIVEAINHFRQVLLADANDRDVIRTLGEAYRMLREWDAATHLLTIWVGAVPDDADAICDLAKSLIGGGEAETALDWLRTMPEPTAESEFLSGCAYAALGETSLAAAAHRQALALDPADRFGAALKLAALGVGTTPAVASPDYIARLFDGYAGRFERALVEGLDYRAPTLLAEALTALLPTSPIRILDLGCGTGLAGVALKPHAGRLDGVDLSPGMLRQAEAKGVYDGLEQDEIVSFVERVPNGFYDLVVAVDVLIYFGALEPVLRSVVRALTAGGLFGVTLERLDAADDWRVDATSRYRHSEAYVGRAAREAGFEIVTIARVSPRREAGAEVPGLLVILRKAGA